MPQEFDVIVIGAGPAGEIVAGRVADGGKRTALIERELVGGECSFWACMPSKALLRPGELWREIGRVPGVAEEVTGPAIDAERVLKRRDEVIHDLDDSGQLPWLEKHEITLIRGEARLAGERRVTVGDEELTAKDAVVIAVGSGAAIPPIDGLREAAPWTSREITNAKHIPDRLLILGGGVVGAEMAQAWSSLGAQVTLVEGSGRVLAKEEPFAAEQVGKSLTEAGVTLCTGEKATRASREDGVVKLEFESGRTEEADELVVAVGRHPHTDELGLETVGLEPGGYIEVDDRLRVAEHPWLYVIGDANGRALLTHAGKYQGRVAADNILGIDSVATHDGPITPRVTFTDPQVAAVGLTLEAAEKQGLPVTAIDLDTSATAGASFYGRNTEGTTRFVVDTDREILVGVTFVGFEVMDFLQAATIAVAGEVPLSKLAHAIAPFPTRSEIWLQFIEAYEKERGISLHAARGRGPSAARAA